MSDEDAVSVQKLSPGVTLVPHLLFMLPAMQTIRIQNTPRCSGKRAREATPLPRRWARARRWAVEKGLGKWDMLSLRQMIAAEARGQG